MYNLSEILTFTQNIAEEGAEIVRRARSEQSFETRFKGGARDIVTTADTAVEKLLIDRINSKYPGHIILSEETNSVIKDGKDYLKPLWIIDPIDGTTNFTRGHFQIGVSIAFSNNGQVQVGVVNAPFQNEVFTAIRGQGAFLNGAPIRSSDTDVLDIALIGTGFPYHRYKDKFDAIMGQLRNVMQHCRDVRRIGAASLDISWVACGRLDGFFEARISPWDMAAACLIAREAGALMQSLDELSPDWERLRGDVPVELYAKNLLVAAPKIFSKLVEILK